MVQGGHADLPEQPSGVTNPFNNEFSFRREKGKLATQFTHTFTPNRKVKQYGLRICLGGASPVDPAKLYRKYLVEQGQFVSLKQKIERTPDAGKLLGAAHVYLWGDGLITRYDFLDLKRLAERIINDSNNSVPSVGKRLWTLMGQDARKLVSNLPAKDWADNYDKGEVAEELSRILERRDFYHADSWKSITLPPEAQDLLRTGISALSDAQLCRLNCLLLCSAFPNLLKPVDAWGDGLSPKTIQTLADAGLDRLWLGSPNWKGLRNRPELVQKAVSLGYLIGPYDSYHSIHSPDEADTWETAQFDRKLYETGPVVRQDGTKKKGFKQKGYILSSLAARPYVEKRVSDLMGQFRCNSWFIDCDTYGDLFDDYSPLHPATQEDDMNARLSRMAWIRDTFKAVIGSEGGSAYAAGTIHFAHGMMTPVIGWGDPDLKDRSSPYYLGGYYPPDGPAVFFKQVPMKAEYRRVYADPRFRLPLYETVFHDSVVATHQWGYGSLKFADDDHARELLELLYNVPPLYHLNTAEWSKRKQLIKAHYDFFSPLHLKAGLLPMTDFRWLSEDRMAQRTVFGDTLEFVANFRNEPFRHDGVDIPGRSILARWIGTGQVRIFTPSMMSP
ncbi:MAG: glycoside hydrolase [Planctomycetes bacterium]|nr:glycoside hydrolase [Planctomycetota bacterium]